LVPRLVIRFTDTPPADLEVTHVDAPDTAQGGTKARVKWSVANNGSNVTDLDRWADAVYIADDAQGSNKKMVFAILHEGVLERGESYDQDISFTLPPSASGTHFLVETNVDPRVLLTAEDELLAPEQAFSVGGRVIDANTVEIEWTVANGYYMYNDKFNFESKTPGIDLGAAQIPPGKKKFDEIFGKELETHRHKVAGFQGHEFAEDGDDARHGKDQFAGVGTLHHLAVEA